MLRAAELTLENGYSHFGIMSGDVSERTQFAGYTPGRAYTTGQGIVIGNTFSSSATTTFVPASPNFVTRPEGGIVIKMLSEVAPNSVDAQLVYNQLHPRLVR